MKDSIITILQNLRAKCAERDNLIMKELGVTQAEYQYCLASLSVPGLETAPMAQCMGVSVSRMSRVVDKMVQQGLLLRKHSEQDRRAIELTFTDKGTQLVNAIKNHRESCEAKITKHLDDNTLAQLRSAMQHLIDTV